MPNGTEGLREDKSLFYLHHRMNSEQRLKQELEVEVLRNEVCCFIYKSCIAFLLSQDHLPRECCCSQ